MEGAMSNGATVTGMGKFCDSICPICVNARKNAGWLKPPVKFMYNFVCGRPMRFLRISSPCVSREKQTGKKPWE
jgi:hypothetical protein